MKFQIDLSVQALSTAEGRSGGYAAYAQRSLWTLDEDDRPFRVENNFRPEAGVFVGADVGGRILEAWPDDLVLSASFVHESNGLELEASRGWNRLVGGLHFGVGVVRGSVLGWYAFRVEDTNRDLARYVGDGEVRLVGDLSRIADGSSLRIRSGFSPDARSGHLFTNLEAGLYVWPAFLPDWLFPGVDGPPIDLVVEWFVGTGEFLYDYAVHTNRIGIGITLHGGATHGMVAGSGATQGPPR